MLFSQANGRKIVSSSNAEKVGKVAGFVVDPRRRRVLAVRVKKSQTGDVLRWSDLTAFGTDAVTVSDASMLGSGGDDVAALSDKAHRLVGKRVLSTTGDELGKLGDVDFDPETGALTRLLVKDGPEVPAESLVGVGSYAVVVVAP